MPIRDVQENDPPTKETTEPALILNDDLAPRAQKSEAPSDDSARKASTEASAKDSVVKGLNNKFEIVDNSTKKFDKNSAVDIAVKSLNEYSPSGPSDAPPAAPPDPGSPEDLNNTIRKIRASEGQKGVDEFEKAVNAKLRYGLEFKTIGDGGAYRIGPTQERLDMIADAQKGLSERQLDGPPMSPDAWESIEKSANTIAKKGGEAAVNEFFNQVNSKVWTGYELQKHQNRFVVAPSQEKMDAMKQVAESAAKEGSGGQLSAREKFKMERTLAELAMSPPEQVKNFNAVINSMMPKNLKFTASENATYIISKAKDK